MPFYILCMLAEVYQDLVYILIQRNTFSMYMAHGLTESGLLILGIQGGRVPWSATHPGPGDTYQIQFDF